MLYNYGLKGGADREAAALKNKILFAEDTCEITGTRYYISNNGDDRNDGLSPESAWQTTEKINQMGDFLRQGDALLFERGSVFRLKSGILCKSGVTYAAYGKGEKPVLLGSDINYADPSLWVKTNRPNLWELKMPTIPCEPSRFMTCEPGIIVLNNEKTAILKKAIRDIKEDFDFAYQKPFNKIYLYYSGGNPGEVFNDIEIGIKRSAFYGMEYVENVTIDNICVKFVGDFCVRFIGFNKNITITNCEFGWVGGAPHGTDSRFGNAIEFWCDCENVLIKNNYIYQVYDAGITPQGEHGMVCDRFRVIGNLIEYCTYSFELFCYDSIGWYTNGEVRDNIMRFAGYGWGQQRPEGSHASHYNSWGYDLTGSYKNFKVENNIFDCANGGLFIWHWKTAEVDHQGFKINGNTYYQKPNERNMAIWYGYENNWQESAQKATCQAEFEEAIAALEEKPKLVKWLSD